MFKKNIIALLVSTALTAQAQNFGFETGDTTGWTSTTLTATGSQTVQAGPNAWVINPYGNYMGTLQIQTGTFNNMTSALGLNTTSVSGITSLLQQQAQTGGGNPTPTTAGWVTRTVTLTAGTQVNLAWQYLSIDYVPYNDGSIATLTKTGSTNTTVVNNYNSQYALLGFTNPGTGDYSTGSYGATGWQVATFNVTESGTYLLGFGVFNLGDQALSPILYIDELQGTTTKNGQTFGAVAPNNSTAPSATTPPPAPTVVSTSNYNQVAVLEAIDTNQSPSTSTSINYTVGKAAGVQHVGQLTATSLTTPWIRTIATTPITVTTYSDQTVTTTTGTTNTTTENFSVTETTNTQQSFSGRADQAQQLDVIRTGIYRNLNRQTAKFGTADAKGRMAINATGIRYDGQHGYNASTSIYGFAYETDVDKDTTVGIQLNRIGSRLSGPDTSDANITGIHAGLYLDKNINGFTVQNDLGHASVRNRYVRSIGPFVNAADGKTNVTWLSSRVYTPSMEGFRPFVGATVYKENTPAVVEGGSQVTSQFLPGTKKVGTTGEVGLSYSQEILGAKASAEVARTSTGINEAFLSVSKVNNNTLISMNVGKNWYQSTTSNIFNINVKVAF